MLDEVLLGRIYLSINNELLMLDKEAVRSRHCTHRLPPNVINANEKERKGGERHEAWGTGRTLMTLFSLMPSFTLMTLTVFELMTIICINDSALMNIYDDVPVAF